jgi:hypothetical protein
MALRLTGGYGIAVGAVTVLLFAYPVSTLAQNPPPAVATSELSGLHGVFGEHVRDLNGDDAGRLWDILLDDAAKPIAAVIDYGGTLGMGERKVAVAWNTLQFVPSDTATPIHLALTMQQLGMLPDFKYGAATTVVGVGQ